MAVSLLFHLLLLDHPKSPSIRSCSILREGRPQRTAPAPFAPYPPNHNPPILPRVYVLMKHYFVCGVDVAAVLVAVLRAGLVDFFILPAGLAADFAVVLAVPV
jgi:hypothetical protein